MLESREYHFAYYYTDSLLTILMFFVIIQLYQQVLAQMNASGYIRRVATSSARGNFLILLLGRLSASRQFE